MSTKLRRQVLKNPSRIFSKFAESMLSTYPYILLAVGVLIIANLIAGRFATRFGAPTLLATLAIGVAFGNGGPHDFDYNYPSLTLRLSEIALCIIIFAGGFESNWKTFRPILRQGISLATLGVVVTMFVTAALAHWLLHWPWLQSLLLGAIVSATDAAAVFSILENSNLKLKPGTREVLELESGANDPMAFFLTLALTAMLLPNAPAPNFFSLTGDFLWTMLVGLGTGLLAGKFIHLIVRRVPLKRGQFPIVLLAWVLILYAVNSILGGSAFLSVYVAGIILGNSPWVQRDINAHFFESLSWLMETTLFLVLGLQVYLQDLPGVVLEGLLLSAALIFVARPAGAWVSLAFFKNIGWRTKVFYSWVGLRGATPIVFALIPIVARVPDAHKIFNIAFIIVIVSMLVQGTTVTGMARATGVKNK
jgi:cell volume regulation protein A